MIEISFEGMIAMLRCCRGAIAVDFKLGAIAVDFKLGAIVLFGVEG
jgi:hypothetical protein